MIVAYFQMMNTMGGEDGMPDLGMGGMEGLKEVCVSFFFVISKLTLYQISKELQTCNVTVYGDVRKRISTCFYVLQFRVNLTLIVNFFYLQHDSDDESKF